MEQLKEIQQIEYKSSLYWKHPQNLDHEKAKLAANIVDLEREQLKLKRGITSMPNIEADISKELDSIKRHLTTIDLVQKNSKQYPSNNYRFPEIDTLIEGEYQLPDEDVDLCESEVLKHTLNIQKSNVGDMKADRLSGNADQNASEKLSEKSIKNKTKKQNEVSDNQTSLKPNKEQKQPQLFTLNKYINFISREYKSLIDKDPQILEVIKTEANDFFPIFLNQYQEKVNRLDFSNDIGNILFGKGFYKAAGVCFNYSFSEDDGRTFKDANGVERTYESVYAFNCLNNYKQILVTAIKSKDKSKLSEAIRNVNFDTLTCLIDCFQDNADNYLKAKLPNYSSYFKGLINLATNLSEQLPQLDENSMSMLNKFLNTFNDPGYRYLKSTSKENKTLTNDKLIRNEADIFIKLKLLDGITFSDVDHFSYEFAQYLVQKGMIKESLELYKFAYLFNHKNKTYQLFKIKKPELLIRNEARFAINWMTQADKYLKIPFTDIPYFIKRDWSIPNENVFYSMLKSFDNYKKVVDQNNQEQLLQLRKDENIVNSCSYQMHYHTRDKSTAIIEDLFVKPFVYTYKYCNLILKKYVKFTENNILGNIKKLFPNKSSSSLETNVSVSS